MVDKRPKYRYSTRINTAQGKYAMRDLINKLNEIEAGDETFVLSESQLKEVNDAVKGHWTEEQEIEDFLESLSAPKEVNGGRTN